MSKYDFLITDLDQKKLLELIQIETDNIYKSPKARQGRSKEEIFRVVQQGKPAEQFLIEHFNCSPSSQDYGDVITKNGLELECKTTRKINDYRHAENTLRKIKRDVLNKKDSNGNCIVPGEKILLWECRDGKHYRYVGGISLKNDNIKIDHRWRDQ